MKIDNDFTKRFSSLKEKNPDVLLLFRCGDFYEIYNEDAEAASKILDLTLTKRSCEPDRMCGFPYHALDTYLPRLIRAGRRVAICDRTVPTEQAVEGNGDKSNEHPQRDEEAKANIFENGDVIIDADGKAWWVVNSDTCVRNGETYWISDIKIANVKEAKKDYGASE